MASPTRVTGFINAGHLLDHLAMLIFPTAVLGMQTAFARPYSELIALALGGFIAFGAGSVPSGWLGDRWSRRDMLAVFFLGIGAAMLATGCCRTLWQLALGLAAIGLFASIYHPVGTAMLVSHAERVGRAIGINGVWGNLGVAFAAILTGSVTQWLGWRWAFWLPGGAALALGGFYLALVPAEANRDRPAAAIGSAGFPPRVIARAFSVLVLATLAGGVVFNATTVALPKLVDERMPQLAGSTFGVGVLVCAVYVVGATAQLVMGRLIDRYPLKVGFLAMALFQAPLLLLGAAARGWPLVAALAALVFVVFGQITFNDAMVARYAAGPWRARVYAVRYLLSFGVAAAAIPLVAVMHAHGGFAALFKVLALSGALVALGALAFPYRRDEIDRLAVAAPAPAAAD